MSARVLLIDELQLVREGLAKLLASLSEINEVIQSATVDEAHYFLSNRKPDLLVLDLNLQGAMQGLDLITEARANNPGLRVLLVTADHRRATVEAAHLAGVTAFVSKRSNLAELRAGVQAALKGQHYLAPAIADGAAAELEKQESQQRALAQLSKREREVLTLVARGQTTKEVASSLKISPKTVEKHRSKLASKLKARGVADLTRFAMDSGLLGLALQCGLAL